MVRDMHGHNDNPTRLHGQRSGERTHDRLTDAAERQPFESLQERLTYSARLAPEERVDFHINPLIAAASDLLSHLSRLAAAPEEGDIRPLNRTLIGQVKLFEAHAGHHAIEHDQMLAARYVLCTVLDEAVLTTAWGSASNWSTMSLLSHFHQETFGGEKFFQLLERLGSNPAKHLHLLELMYLCLALGFKGKYRVTLRANDELDDIRDGLYRQIRQLRGEVPMMLSPHWRGSQEDSLEPPRLMPSWLVVIFTLMTLAVMYSGFAWVLGKQRETVLKPYQFVDSVALERQSQNRGTR
ncbi:type IVB secretion system protein IcmH/DotU [Pseudomonas viridiflava]|uniref:type IVB secretion system protein IcmH/DotU n=1 Tax=Pseudomonas viridiflava TaxID=33069 RepID=UPI002EB74012|nr:type IVB secretion system protein IcmH/DotU [Pseudomonas viridiflava]